jgi:hypothetical protein
MFHPRRPLLIVGYIGRLEQQDVLIACGGMAGLLMLAAGLSLVADVGGAGPSFEAWMAGRGRSAYPSSRRVGMAGITAGTIFLVSAAVGVALY